MHHRKSVTLLDHLGKTGYLATLLALVIVSLAVGAAISLASAVVQPLPSPPTLPRSCERPNRCNAPSPLSGASTQQITHGAERPFRVRTACNIRGNQTRL